MSERIEQIKTRLEAATPGPWKWHDFASTYTDEPETIIVHTGNFDWEAIADGEYIAAMSAWDSQQATDAEFIANAPADVAFLLGMVDELRARVSALQEDRRALTLRGVTGGFH